MKKEDKDIDDVCPGDLIVYKSNGINHLGIVSSVDKVNNLFIIDGNPEFIVDFSKFILLVKKETDARTQTYNS